MFETTINFCENYKMFWLIVTACISAVLYVIYRLCQWRRTTEDVNEPGTEPEVETEPEVDTEVPVKKCTRTSLVLKREIGERQKQMASGEKIHVNNHKKRCKKFQKLNSVRNSYCVIMNTIISDYVANWSFTTENEAVEELKKIRPNDMKSYLDIANLRKFFGEIPKTLNGETDGYIRKCFKTLGPADNKLRHNAFDYIYDDSVYQDIAGLLRNSFEALQLISGLDCYSRFKNKKFLDKKIKQTEAEVQKL